MPKANKQNVEPLVLDTYLAVIKNSLGAKMFRNYYAKVDGRKTDIMRDGELSCAFFVSSVLTLAKLIKNVHGTVDTTVKDLLDTGWVKIAKPKIGSVLVWEAIDFGGGEAHKHIGFYVGDGMAISNSDKLKCPVEHEWNFNSKRKLELILWYPLVK